MSESAFFWILGIGAAIIAAIAAAFWKHVGEDVKAHERLARIENQVDRNTTEIDKLRQDRHDFKDEIKRSIWELMDGRFREFKEEIRAWLKRDGG